MLAQKLGVWIPLDEVPDAWEAVTSVFRDYGYRRLRSRARIKFLVKDWGAEKFRQVLQDEYLKRELIDGPPPADPAVPIDHIGVHPQVDGKFYVGAAPIAGRVSGGTLVAVAKAAERAGSGRVRLTPQQKLVVLDVPEAQVAPLQAELAELGLETKPSPWRRSVMACTGLEFCKLAIVETKARAVDLVAEMERRLAGLDVDINVNVNGCPNACARTQIADIGLKGQLVPGPDGEMVEGFQVHLGGSLTMASTENANFGRKLRGLKTTAAELNNYVERLARRYAAERTDGESFAAWVARADEGALR
jgi:sulfite reductase (ferredoxin)